CKPLLSRCSNVRSLPRAPWGGISSPPSPPRGASRRRPQLFGSASRMTSWCVSPRAAAAVASMCARCRAWAGATSAPTPHGSRLTWHGSRTARDPPGNGPPGEKRPGPGEALCRFVVCLCALHQGGIYMDRIGIVAATFEGLSLSQLRELAREAESAGVAALFLPEFMNDALANCQAVAQGTSRLTVGSWVANIYLRHPALCAQTAVTVAGGSQGRFILGLGVSHRPIVEGVYQEKMERPRDFLRQYVTTVRDVVTGQGYPGAPIQPRAATHTVPIYIAALALGTVELAGEVADGVMLDLCPTSRLPKGRAALERGAAKAGRQASAVEVTAGLLACLGDDREAAGTAARAALARYGQLPFYNKLFENSGFRQEAAALARGDAHAVSDRMVEELVLLGPPARWR